MLFRKPRIRLNLSLTAKGLVQWDCTSENTSVEEAKKGLEDAIDALKQVIREKGLTECSQD